MARTDVSVGAGAGVTALNGLVGAVTLAAGTGITLVPVGNTITINSSGGMAIGGAVTGGTDPAVLYIDGGLLAQDPTNFFYDPTAGTFNVTTDDGGNNTSQIAMDAVSGYSLIAANDGARQAASLYDVAGQQILSQVVDGTGTAIYTMHGGGGTFSHSFTTNNGTGDLTTVTYSSNTPSITHTATDGTGSAQSVLNGSVYTNVQSVTDGVGNSGLNLGASATTYTHSLTSYDGTTNVVSYNASANAQSIVLDATNGTSDSAITLDGDATPKIVLDTTNGTTDSSIILGGGVVPTVVSTATDGTSLAIISLNGSTPTVTITADDGAVTTSVIQLNGSNAVSTITGTDGTRNSQFTVDGGATPEIRSVVTDGSDSNAVAVNQHWTEFGGGMVYNTTVITANVGTVTLDENLSVIVINKTVAGAITVNLPASANITQGFTLIIKDGKGDAGTNNITIDGNAGETIDGAATYVMNINYQSTKVMWNGTEWSVI